MKHIAHQDELKQIIANGLTKHKGVTPILFDVKIDITYGRPTPLPITVSLRDDNNIVISKDQVLDDESVKQYLQDMLVEKHGSQIDIKSFFVKRRKTPSEAQCIVEYDIVEMDNNAPLNPFEVKDAIAHALERELGITPEDNVSRTDEDQKIKLKDLGQPVPKASNVVPIRKTSQTKPPKVAVDNTSGIEGKVMVDGVEYDPNADPLKDADPIGCLRKLHTIQQASLQTAVNGDFGEKMISMQREQIRITEISIASLEAFGIKEVIVPEPKPAPKRKATRKMTLIKKRKEQTPEDVRANREIILQAIREIPVQYLNAGKLIDIVSKKSKQKLSKSQMSCHLRALDIDLRDLKRDAIAKRVREIIETETYRMSTDEVADILAEEDFNVSTGDMAKAVNQIRKSLGKQSGRAYQGWEMDLLKKQIQEAIDSISNEQGVKVSNKNIIFYMARIHGLQVSDGTVRKVRQALDADAQDTTKACKTG